MKLTRAIFNFLIVSLTVVSACKKPYTPAAISVSNSFLVVQGVINTGNDSTQIMLSQTQKLSDTTTLIPETKATVYVEDDKNNRYQLTEFKGGIYKCPAFSNSGVGNFRVHIFRSNSKEYVSDYVAAYKTPPVDTITYKELSTGVQFFTSTHDPTNAARYYRWDFDETWEYTAGLGGLNSFIYDLKGDTVRFRNPDTENITYCWINTRSNVIDLASTAGLSQSVINEQPVGYIDVSSYKLRRGYSMLLHQYSLSKEAYEYWQALKKNTEQLGGIFDAQPSGLTGNLHAVADATEPVLGYMSASNITSKRILIDSHNIGVYQPQPPSEIPVPGDPDCGYHAILFEPRNTLAARLQRTLASGDTIITGGIFDDVKKIQIGYKVGRVICADCTKKLPGGSNNRPPYWPKNL